MEIPHETCKICTVPLPLPFSCDLCKSKFCSDHANYDAHSCPSFQDKKVTTCPFCIQPLITVAGKEAKQNSAFNEVETKISREKQRLSAIVKRKLDTKAKLGSLSESAWTLTTGSFSEDTVLASHEYDRLNQLKQEREDILMAIHLDKCPKFEGGAGGGGGGTIVAGFSSPSAAAPPPKKKGCSFKACREATGFTMLCKSCGKMYCVSHRLPEVHECATQRQQQSQQQQQRPTSAATAPASRSSADESSSSSSFMMGMLKNAAASITKAVGGGGGSSSNNNNSNSSKHHHHHRPQQPQPQIETRMTPAAQAALARQQQHQQQQPPQKPKTAPSRPASSTTPAASSSSSSSANLTDSERELLAMGFPIERVREALARTGGRLNAAIDVLVAG